MLLLFITNDLNGFADCFHGCGDNSLRRVRFNVSKSPAPDFSQFARDPQKRSARRLLVLEHCQQEKRIAGSRGLRDRGQLLPDR